MTCSAHHLFISILSLFSLDVNGLSEAHVGGETVMFKFKIVYEFFLKLYKTVCLNVLRCVYIIILALGAKLKSS